MKKRRSEGISIIPKAVSAVLVVWLSSVLVLVCCTPHLFMASAASVETDEASCPMQKGHKCCEKNKDAKSLSESEKDNTDCCVFKPNRTLSGDLKTVKLSKQVQVVEEKPQTPKPVYFIKNSYQPIKVYHSAIRNRGSTYIQNCVFRI